MHIFAANKIDELKFFCPHVLFGPCLCLVFPVSGFDPIILRGLVWPKLFDIHFLFLDPKKK